MHYGGYDASKNGQPTIHVIDRSNNQTNEPLLNPAPENKQISENDFAQVLNPTNALRHNHSVESNVSMWLKKNVE